MRLSCLLALACLLAAPLTFAQPWTLPGGTAQVSLGFEAVSASERFDHRAEAVPFDDRLPDGVGSHYQAREFVLQSRYGLMDQLTLVGRLPLRRVAVQAPREAGQVAESEEFDLGDATIGLRMGLAERAGLTGPWELGIGLDVKLPLGYRRNVVPAVGSGQIDADLTAYLGRRLLDGAAHASLTAGYRFRSGIYATSRLVECPPGDDTCFVEQAPLEYGDQILLAAQARYIVLGRLHVHAFSSLDWGIRKPQPVERLGGVFLPDRFADRRVALLGGGVAAHLFGETFLAFALSVPAYGRNAVNATTFSVALEVNL